MAASRFMVFLRSIRVATKKFAVPFFVNPTGSQLDYSLRRRFLARSETIAIELEKKHAHNKPRALVSVDEGMILNDAYSVICSELKDIRARVGASVERPSQRRVKQRFVPNPVGAAVFDKLPIV